MSDDTSSADALIREALPIFGQLGLEGASTRAIAKAANKPMSAITYHFGGKQGLYLACARHIGATMGGFAEAAIERASAPTTAAEAQGQLSELLAILTTAMVRDETAEFARFIVREQQEPTGAFDIIYGGTMGTLLARMVALMRCVAGDITPEIELRVRVITLMGQVMAFRVARAATLRLTGWSDIGDAERALIDRIVQANLTAILDSLKPEKQP